MNAVTANRDFVREQAKAAREARRNLEESLATVLPRETAIKVVQQLVERRNREHEQTTVM